ncbi:MAG TPA: hypothetical protein VMR21_09465 [Vicinamibacteria bacterium]|nr:hypothetical protein [Vicinamibacteria bacterium]
MFGMAVTSQDRFGPDTEGAAPTAAASSLPLHDHATDAAQPLLAEVSEIARMHALRTKVEEGGSGE